MGGWAIDFGNTHTRVARWDEAAQAPRLLELPEVCRRPGSDEPLEGARLVPSATHVLEEPGLLARLGGLAPVQRLWFLGRQALIGRRALEANLGVAHPGFAPSFKPFLEREALRTIARAGRRPVTARDVARLFARELLAEVKRVTGTRIREATLTAPVDAYEAYRAELQLVARALGIRRVRFIDEPVAAALGYGLGLDRDRLVLVVDFGGGTFHLALVELDASGADRGTGRVVAKAGRAVGGNLVNRWIVAEACARAGFDLPEPGSGDDELSFWWRLATAEACRVKEALFFEHKAALVLAPPPVARRLPRPGMGLDRVVDLSRGELVDLLRRQGLYDTIEEALEGVLRDAAAQGRSEASIEEVLMVGGSTLLPEVYPLFEGRFGRNRVRAWQPFEAVAFGACAFAAESVRHADFIVHDYAFVTYDAKTHEPQYTVIVPRGTRFPTAPDLWKRQLVPTCALGEPETMFKLVVCEIGRAEGEERRFVWDERGAVKQLGGAPGARGAAERTVVPLNDSNPTLGYLDPPHSPRDRRPRLEIAFGVNAERWLTATVVDLRTRRLLLDEATVVRLL